MMKKSFFMRTYNLNIYLILSTLLTGFLGCALNFLVRKIDLTLLGVLDLPQFNIYLTMGSQYSYLAMTCILSILFVTITLEILQRVRFDNLLNYFKSIHHTIQFRNFLIQREESEEVTTSDAKTITNYNPINDSFNPVLTRAW